MSRDQSSVLFTELPRGALVALSAIALGVGDLERPAHANPDLGEIGECAVQSDDQTNRSPQPAIAPCAPEAQAASPTFTHPDRAQTVQRTIEVEQINGEVTFAGDPVQPGDRLDVGSGELQTGENARAVLAIDNRLATVELAEQTTLQVTQLSGTPDNSMTALSVERGQIRLSVRSLASPLADINSPLGSDGRDRLLARQIAQSNYPVRIETPAGVAGVRGTSFGVNVGNNGKTGISTLDGSVAALARGQEILVNAGQYVTIEPGQTPSSPQASPPLAELQQFRTVRTGPFSAWAIGRVHPHDLVLINGKAVETDTDGRFRVKTDLPPSRRLRIVVRGPSVRTRVYEKIVR